VAQLNHEFDNPTETALMNYTRDWRDYSHY